MKKIYYCMAFIALVALLAVGCGDSGGKKPETAKSKNDNYGTVVRKNGPKIDKPGEWNKSELSKDSGETTPPPKNTTGTRPKPVPIDTANTKTTPVTPKSNPDNLTEAYKSKEWVIELLPPYGFNNRASLVLKGPKNVTVDPAKDTYRVSAEYVGMSSDKKENRDGKEMSYDLSVFKFDINAKRVTYKQGMEALKEGGDVMEEIIKDVKCTTTVGRGLLQITWLHGKWLFFMSMTTDEIDIDDDDFERVGKFIVTKIANAVAFKDKNKGYLNQ